MKTPLFYQIALSLLPGIGAVTAKSLIAHCGSAEAVFKEKGANLMRIPGIAGKTVEEIRVENVLSRAEEELNFIRKNKVEVLYYQDDNYPRRLKYCEDGPILLYLRGNPAVFKRRIIAFVGSRAATEYGKGFCRSFIKDLKVFQPLILSGLAYGIDIAAHKSSLENQLPTVAVLGSGLDRIYPGLHKPIAEKIIDQGGALVTEFISGSGPDRENFPKRNRIIAGISEAIVVVEAAIKGGALITAEIANSYNREVFAVPGKLGDAFSEGCNYLIKTHKAALLSNVNDLKYILNWEESAVPSAQVSLFPDLSSEESQVHKALMKKKQSELDELCFELQQPVSKVLPLLMTLEIKGAVKSLPGRIYVPVM